MISIRYLLLSLLVLISILSFTQTKKDLEKKRKEKQKEIQLTKKMLNETKKKEKQSLNKLQIIKQQIKIREDLITDIQDEVMEIDGEIVNKNDEIKRLNEEITTLKNDYAELIFISYKANRKTDLISFLFSSENVNQAIKRVQYLREIAAYRENQLAQINQAKENLKGKVDDLHAVKSEKTVLLGEQNNEKKELEGDKMISDKMISDLQARQKELKAELAQKQKALNKLNEQIRALIQKEIDNSNKTGKTTDKGTKTSGNKVILSPDGQKLADDFSANKLKLPWPVGGGFISKHFGKVAHPNLKGIYIENNGIDISTVKGSEARAVFKGEVRAVFSIPGMQKAVMIAHGNYYTVYAHLDQVLVNKGDKVNTKDRIGIIYTDEEEGKTELHFELWFNTNKQNPESWLSLK